MRRGEPRETVEVVCTRKVRETEKAVLVVITDTGEQKWIPKSVVEDEDEMDDGAVVLTIHEWFCEKEGLG